MEIEVLGEFYESCLNSEALYKEYAGLIFEALYVDTTNLTNYLCSNALDILSSDKQDISKYLSLLFIRDALLENNL